MFQRFRPGVFLAMILMFLLAACGGTASSSNGGSSGGSTSSAPTATTQPTATPKAKPSAVPMTTVPFCEGLVSFAEANQALSPPAAIVNVVPGNSTDASTCQYISAPGHVPLLLTFLAFPAGTQMSTYANEAAAKNYAGATISTSHAVSGVGDQAWFLAGAESSGGLSAHADALYVADGSIVIIVENFNINGASPIGSTDDATVQSEFVQLGNLIVSRF